MKVAERSRTSRRTRRPSGPRGSTLSTGRWSPSSCSSRPSSPRRSAGFAPARRGWRSRAAGRHRLRAGCPGRSLPRQRIRPVRDPTKPRPGQFSPRSGEQELGPGVVEQRKAEVVEDDESACRETRSEITGHRGCGRAVLRAAASATCVQRGRHQGRCSPVERHQRHSRL